MCCTAPSLGRGNECEGLAYLTVNTTCSTMWSRRILLHHFNRSGLGETSRHTSVLIGLTMNYDPNRAESRGLTEFAS
jgi:hypothetical protein